MKPKSHLIVALAAALSTAAASAQGPGAPPPPPQPPLQAARPDDGGPRGPGRPGGRFDGPGRKRDQPGDDRDRDREKGEPQPFLGLITSEVPPALTAQLGLPEGFGLMVDEVIPDSPAAAAGVQKYDVLQTFNDQQLVNPDQFATLVRAAGKDKEVALTLMRKGQSTKVSAKVGERMTRGKHGPEPDWHAMPGFLQGLGNGFGGGPGSFGGGGDKPNEFRKWDGEGFGPGRDDAGPGRQFRDEKRALNEKMDRVREEVDRATRAATDAAAKAAAKASSLNDPFGPGKILHEAEPGGGGKIKIFSQNGVTTIDGAKSHLILKDGDGIIEIGNDNGHRTLVVKDANGNVSFTGPIDSDDDRKNIPADVQKKLDELKKLQEREPKNSSADPTRGVSADASVSVEEEKVQ